MINLLPPADQQEIHAGRANSLLLRYITLSLVVLGILLAWIGVIYFNLYNTQSDAERTKKANEAKAATRQDIVSQADKFRGDLSIAKQIMDKQVNYTETVTRVATAMPADTILDSISIDPKLFDKDTTIAAHAKSQEAAIALKDSLQASGLFTKVYFQSLTAAKQQEGGAAVGPYPYAILLGASFNRSEVTKK